MGLQFNPLLWFGLQNYNSSGGGSVPGLITTLTPNSTASASANSAIIQAALNAYPEVQILTPGNYYVGATHVIPSNTTINIGEGVTLTAYAAPGSSPFLMFVNQGYQNTVETVTSVYATPVYSSTNSRILVGTAVFSTLPPGIAVGSWFILDQDPNLFWNAAWQVTAINGNSVNFNMAAGAPQHRVTVTNSATTSTAGTNTLNVTSVAGLAVGSGVVNITATGIAPNTIITAVGASSITLSQNLTANITSGQTVYVESIPAPATSMVGVMADYGITITGGGKLNSNYTPGGFVKTFTYNDHCIMISKCVYPRVGGLSGAPLIIQDAYDYAVCMAWCYFPVADGIFGNGNGADGCHIYGPSWYPQIKNLTGTFGDDGAIFQTIDGIGYAPVMPPDAGGSFYRGGVMENIKPILDGNVAQAVIYPNGGPTSTDLGYRMYGHYRIENIGHGSVDNNFVGSSGWSPSSAFAMGAGYCPSVGGVESISLKNVHGNAGCSNNGGGIITIEKFTLEDYVNYAVGENVAFFVDCVNLGKLTFQNCSIVNVNTNSVTNFQSSNCTIGQVNFIDCIFNSPTGAVGMITASSPTIGSIFFRGGRWVNYCALYKGTPTWTGTTPPIVFDGVDFLASSGSSQYPVSFANFNNDLTFVNCIASGPLINAYGTTGTNTVRWNNLHMAGSNNGLFYNGAANVTIISGTNFNPVVRSTPSTGNTVTFGNQWGYQKQEIVPAAGIAALTIALPTVPIDGETIEMTISQPVAALTQNNGTLLGIPPASSATFTATISGNVMTVSAISAGVIVPGQILTGTGLTTGTYVLAYGSGGTTGSGGTGTYTISTSSGSAATASAGQVPPNFFGVWRYSKTDTSWFKVA